MTKKPAIGSEWYYNDPNERPGSINERLRVINTTDTGVNFDALNDAGLRSYGVFLPWRDFYSSCTPADKPKSLTVMGVLLAIAYVLLILFIASVAHGATIYLEPSNLESPVVSQITFDATSIYVSPTGFNMVRGEPHTPWLTFNSTFYTDNLLFQTGENYFNTILYTQNNLSPYGIVGDNFVMRAGNRHSFGELTVQDYSLHNLRSEQLYSFSQVVMSVPEPNITSLVVICVSILVILYSIAGQPKRGSVITLIAVLIILAALVFYII